MNTSPIKLAVLVSGSGTTLQNLIDVIGAGDLSASIGIVIASKPAIKSIERAANAKVMNFVVDRKLFTDVASFSKQVFALCDDAAVDLICLAGWLCFLEIPEKWRNRVINIHPSLLPSFGGKGMYGAKVHQAVIDHGCKVSGCTVHFVDGVYDAGPIILQRTCRVMDDDTADVLAQRVFEEEKVAYPEAIRRYATGQLKIDGRRVRTLEPSALE